VTSGGADELNRPEQPAERIEFRTLSVRDGALERAKKSGFKGRSMTASTAVIIAGTALSVRPRATRPVW